MERRELFLETLADIGDRIAPGRVSEYGLLQVGAKLRLLLLDGGRLMDLVNEQYRMTLTFRVGTGGKVTDAIRSLSPTFHALGDGFDPDLDTSGAPGLSGERTVSPKGLLAAPVLWWGPTACSVRDVIDFLANVAGGVHAGVPTSDSQRALAAMADELNVGGLTPSAQSVMAISRVVIVGLEPLRREVLRDLSGGDVT